MAYTESLQRRAYDFSVSKWWVSSLFLTMASIWFILLQFFGRNWGLVDNTGVLSRSGKIFTCIFIFINIAASVLKTLGDRIDTDKKSRGQYILTNLISNLNGAKLTKLDRYTKALLKNSTEFDFEDTVSPKEQIHVLLESIRNMVSCVSDTEESKIGLSILFYNGNDWTWLDKINIENDLDIEELVNNTNSSIRHIIDGKKQLIFWPDKRVGKEKNEYISGQCDELYNNLGSIYCKDIGIKDEKGNDIITAILSVTTYGNQICGQENEIDKSRFVADIMPEFELQLQVELCLLYMKGKNKQKKQKSLRKRKPTVSPRTKSLAKHQKK